MRHFCSQRSVQYGNVPSGNANRPHNVFDNDKQMKIWTGVIKNRRDKLVCETDLQSNSHALKHQIRLHVAELSNWCFSALDYQVCRML